MIWNNLKDKKVILASKSPRRISLLEGMGIAFETCSTDWDETYPNELKAGDIPQYLAQMKGQQFSHLIHEQNVLISADTIVWHQDQALNKPKDIQEAKEMLSSLSQQTHQVFTGIYIQNGERKWSFVDETKVTFKKIESTEIEYYIQNFAPLDKAGSYGAQDFLGYIGIEKLEGSYYNVMGFPTHKIHDILKLI